MGTWPCLLSGSTRPFFAVCYPETYSAQFVSPANEPRNAVTCKELSLTQPGRVPRSQGAFLQGHISMEPGALTPQLQGHLRWRDIRSWPQVVSKGGKRHPDPEVPFPAAGRGASVAPALGKGAQRNDFTGNAKERLMPWEKGREVAKRDPLGVPRQPPSPGCWAGLGAPLPSEPVRGAAAPGWCCAPVGRAREPQPCAPQQTAPGPSLSLRWGAQAPSFLPWSFLPLFVLVRACRGGCSSDLALTAERRLVQYVLPRWGITAFQKVLSPITKESLHLKNISSDPLM